jgi:hypothetical protein
MDTPFVIAILAVIAVTGLDLVVFAVLDWRRPATSFTYRSR